MSVVSAFPGTGRTHLIEHSGEGSVLDLDSPPFSWIETEEGRVRNPDFPANYIAAIMENIGRASVILVSSHEEVRTALETEGIDFTLVYPAAELKADYLAGFEQRGRPEAFIDLIGTNWETYLGQLSTQGGCERIELQADQHLSDVIS